MADALDSDNIARQSFEVGRRGYEQQEVRAFLHEVAALVDRLHRESVELRARAVRAEARAAQADDPDEALLLERLGEETTRVLFSAREAAAEIRGKAEIAAERIVADATLDAAEARADAMRGADRRVVEAEAERESLLHAARTELAVRQAEAEAASSIIRQEAAAEADAVRAELAREQARVATETESVLEAARVQGREMVAEAQTVRDRVLQDLAVRRKKARRQVEQLNAGRERLLEAYEVVRRLIDEATSELGVSLSDARDAGEAAARRVEEEPELSLDDLDREVAELRSLPAPVDEGDDDSADDTDEDDDRDRCDVELSGGTSAPTTSSSTPPVRAPEAPEGRRRGRRRGTFVDRSTPPPDEAQEDRPVPEPAAPAAVVADDEPWSAGSVRLVAAPPDEPAPSAEPQTDEPSERATDEPHTDQDHDDDAGWFGTATRERTEPDPVEDTDEASVPDHGPEPEPLGTPEPIPPRGGGPRRRARGLRSRAELPPDDDDEADDSSPSVTELFARLRAEQARPVADAEPPAAEPVELAEPIEEDSADEDSATEPDRSQTAFTVRVTALEPVVKDLGRALKRALADEQNEVLDRLRRAKPSGVDDLLPDPDAHAARWAGVAEASLVDAAAAGADWAGGKAGAVADLADEMARSLCAPLRDRVDRSFVASDGNLDEVTDRVRALYREWKGQRLAETADHFTSAAYARGVYDALGAKASVRWVVDPSEVPCPDCDDNVLGGTVTRGTEFPTGHECAPAHPGCHCLVLASDG